jgi:HSP20 family molecular chaperone IbpA
MSFFPRSFITNDPSTSFTPLFRLLDDFENYRGTTSTPNGHHHQRGNHLKTFSPKFDVKELESSYELHGDLPGIEQKDVEIEFTDAQTLTISGRTERSYTSGTPPAGFVEGAQAAGTITEGSEHDHKAHKATVEDAGDGDGVVVDTPTTANTEVTHAKETAKPKEPEAKYWVSERSVGQFQRSFSFPVRVDQDHVQASMKNGVLSITVPKAKKHESKKITIS